MGIIFRRFSESEIVHGYTMWIAQNYDYSTVDFVDQLENAVL